MELFEYILILTSVIYALAVAQILAGVSSLAQTSATVRTYLPQSLWVFNLFLYIFLIWWATWEFRSVAWTFPQYAYLLIAPTLLYFVCSLLIPLRIEGNEVNLEKHFLRIRRPFFTTYLLASIAVMVDGNLLADEPLWHTGRLGHVSLLIVAIWALFTENRKSHVLIAIITLLALLGTVAARFWVPR